MGKNQGVKFHVGEIHCRRDDWTRFIVNLQAVVKINHEVYGLGSGHIACGDMNESMFLDLKCGYRYCQN